MVIEHDVRDFVTQTANELQAEYERIRRDAAKDGGTAGDEGEENWAALLRKWLPPIFQVVTKGKIISQSGSLSPQVDVLILAPTYPKFLLEKKKYLAGGVIAAFECKLTLKAAHIREAVDDSSEISRLSSQRFGTPRSELCSDIIFGLLAHSHSWKGSTSKPIENVTTALVDADKDLVKNPRECIDLVCVADLATWDCMKQIELSRPPPHEGGGPSSQIPPIVTAYLCHDPRNPYQRAECSPIGQFLMSLYSRLSWSFPEMRPLEYYFSGTLPVGMGVGQCRMWPPDVLSEAVRGRILQGELKEGRFDPWSAWLG